MGRTASLTLRCEPGPGGEVVVVGDWGRGRLGERRRKYAGDAIDEGSGSVGYLISLDAGGGICIWCSISSTSAAGRGMMSEELLSWFIKGTYNRNHQECTVSWRHVCGPWILNLGLLSDPL